MSKQVVAVLQAKFPAAILKISDFRGDECVIVQRDVLEDLMRFLRDDPETAMEMLMDLSCVDLGPRQEPRFHVVYHLYSLSKRHRLRVKAPVGDQDARVPSVTGLWAAADWMEREAWDMFGVVFEGHPNLRRLLMYEEFKGHPLRRDYPVQGRQSYPVPQDLLDQLEAGRPEERG